MKIGIVGSADRAVAWEKHLRPHRSVSEVTITAKLSEVGDVDACLLLGGGNKQLQKLLEAVKAGYHTFLIAPLPTNTALIEKVYHTAEEANVLLQFSHWPTLAPASKWMAQKVSSPSFIQISRKVSYSEFRQSSHEFDYYWIDELAFCLRWINGSVHHMDLKTMQLSHDNTYGLHILLRFDSGATANIYVDVSSAASDHHRLASNNLFLLDCNVLEQTVRLGEENDSGHLFFEKKTFDPSKAAELAVLDFIKSIQLKRPTIYNGYHLLELAKTADKISNRLNRV